MRFHLALVLGSLASLFCFPGPRCAAQRTQIPRFDLYAGFSDLNTPGLNDQNAIGLHVQAGVNATRWSSFGIDYSTQHGSSTITAGLATPALQQELAYALPPGYRFRLPYDATVQSFSGGGQLVLRHFK